MEGREFWDATAHIAVYTNSLMFISSDQPPLSVWLLTARPALLLLTRESTRYFVSAAELITADLNVPCTPVCRVLGIFLTVAKRSPDINYIVSIGNFRNDCKLLDVKIPTCYECSVKKQDPHKIYLIDYFLNFQ